MEKSGPPPAYGDQPPASNPSYPQAPPPQGYPAQPPPPAGAYPPAQPPPPGYAQPPPAGYAQPPPPGAYPQPYATSQTVIVNQPVVAQQYRESPVTCNCPYCQANITTSTSRSCGAMVWIVAGIICAVGLFIPFVWLGCCLIPFCIPSLYDTEHKCPNCNRQLGVHKAGGI